MLFPFRKVSSRPIGEKKVKIFLSPVAGQVVDVGASRAGQLPCSQSIRLLARGARRAAALKKKVKIFLSPVAGQAVDVGASRAGRLPCSQSIRLLARDARLP